MPSPNESSFLKRKCNGEFSSKLTLDQSVQEIEQGDPSKNDKRYRGVSFFFVIHFRNQIARSHIESDARGKRQCIIDCISHSHVEQSDTDYAGQSCGADRGGRKQSLPGGTA